MERDTMIDLREEEPFKERLGDELRAAALRLDQAPTEATRRPWSFELPRLPVVALGGILLTLLAAGALLVQSSGSEPVAANSFEVIRNGDSIDVLVADLVADPGIAEAELVAQGVMADVRTVPVSPSLVGRLVGVEATFDDEIRRSEDGFVESFTFVPMATTQLTLEIGREAGAGESFDYSWEPHVCEAVAAESDVDSQVAAAEQLGYPEIAWLGSNGEWLEEPAARSAVEAAFRIVHVEVKSPGELLIVLSDDPAETVAPCR